MQMSMVAAVLSGFLLALAAPGVVRLARGASGWLLALLPAALTAYFVRYLGPVAAGRAVAVSYPWAPDLGVSLSFYLDGLSLLFALLICGIGAWSWSTPAATCTGIPTWAASMSTCWRLWPPCWAGPGR
jgi:NADH:ubiquinone oxidoreductase subunit 5 (subunit L)/multisubunit Na+/H+ antiporter MnhA subunit